MLSWLKTLFVSRYAKSTVRYLIAAAIGYLQASGEVPVWDMFEPLLDLVLPALAGWLAENQDVLADILSGILIALLGTWSIRKNKNNKIVEQVTQIKVE